MDFLSKIDMERVKRGISFKQLAVDSELSEKTVKNLFSGKNTNPNIGSVIALCNALQISVAGVFVTGGETVISQDAEAIKAILRIPAEGKTILLNLIRYMTQ